MGIREVIWVSTSLFMPKRWEDLELLALRWSFLTHTFIIAWGEFTPTLEDVHVLLRLPCFEVAIPAISALDKVTIDSTHALKKALTDSSHYNSSLRLCPSTSGKHNHAGWIRFFYGIKHPAIDGQHEEDRIHEKGPSYGSPLELAAFIAF